MGLFEGKTTTERNKTIAAIALGVISLFALYMAFGRGMFGGSTTTATSKATPTPKVTASPAPAKTGGILPTAEEQRFIYETTPVVYRPGLAGAPDAGRNIFAFFEPPPPTPFVPPPPPSPTPPKPASPTPTPVYLATAVSPASVYAGSRAFRLDVYGDRFTPDAKIYFNQAQMPTTFDNAQHLSASIADNLISQEGQRQVIVQSPDGKSYSVALVMTVQAPPKPTALQYIGMMGRKRYNNDTAYFTESGKPNPFGARLNDVVGSRFRLIDISSSEVVVEDIALGFKHRIKIATASGSPSGPPQFSPNGFPQGQLPNGQRIPQPPRQPGTRPTPNSKDDVDDNDDPTR